ncbi:MAG: hypothetical protein QG597_2013 [Actinomycetota bacterium]|nr:hypothetical protein [Actinomycetota bacterium]
MFERGQITSYAACGLPYWVAGQVPRQDMLIARTPRQHRARGIDVRLGTEVVGIDPRASSVTVRTQDGQESIEGYDQLVIGTGALPVRPPIPGSQAPNVATVHTVPGTQDLVDQLTRSGSAPRRAVVVGAGFIGIEMAEAFLDRGIAVTVIDQATHPMVSFDPDMGAVLAESMADQGVACAFGQAVREVELDEAGLAQAVLTDAGRYPCELVVLALGVRPNTGIAIEAGLPVGDSGGLLTDRRQQVRDHEDIWAAGDCVETYHRLLRTTVHMPLGTHANKQGRVLGLNVAGEYATFPGIIGTAITKVGTAHLSRTGLTEAQAAQAGFDAVAAKVQTSVIAGYMPNPGRMITKVLAERGTGRLLGGQIIGDRVGAAKRIDTLAMAIWTGFTAEDLTGADLSYAPPFSPTWDPVQTAARRLLPTI